MPATIKRADYAAMFGPTMDDRFRLVDTYLNRAAGTALLFEQGKRRKAALITMTGGQRVFEFNRNVMGAL